MKIYVGNLSYEVTDDKLNAMFTKFGAVDSATIIIDRDTGRSKGFGFVEMTDLKQAQAALAGLNETELDGRSITVNEARPREPRRDSGGGGRGGYGGGGGRSGGGGGRGRY
jgi:cold-inducible RNA-binding protein